MVRSEYFGCKYGNNLFSAYIVSLIETMLKVKILTRT